MDRIPASERTRERLKALMEGHGEKSDLRSELVRLAARLIVEEGLEGETADALGREYYVRGAAAGAGYRNGYRTGRLKTAEGMIEYAAPQISDRAVPFRSRLREIIRGRSEELEALAVEMYARGLSTRDIEALFADERGQSLLSRARSRNASRARRGNAVSPTSCAICRARCRRINGRSSRRAPLPATRPPRRRSPACCGTTLRRPMARPCRRRWHVCRTTLKRALPICASHSRIGGRSAPPTCSSGCSVRSGGAPRSSRMPSANAPYSN